MVDDLVVKHTHAEEYQKHIQNVQSNPSILP